MIKNILYMLKFVWRADKSGALLQLIPQIYTAFFMSADVLVLKFLIDGVAAQRSLMYLLGVAITYSIISMIAGLMLTAFSTKYSGRMQIRVERYMSEILLKKVIAIDTEQYDNPKFYDSLTKAIANSNTRAAHVYTSFISFCGSVMTVASLMTVMAVLSPIFIIVSIISMIILHYFNIAIAKKQFQMNEALAPTVRRTNYFRELLFQRGSVLDIKQFTAHGKLLLRKFYSALMSQHEIQSQMVNEQVKHSVRVQSINVLSANLFPYGYLAVGAFYGIVSIANMSALITASSGFRQNINSISAGIAQLKEHSMYINHFREIMEYNPIIETPGGELVRGINTLTFENVSFRYPNTENHVLNGVSFTINRGEKTALVGINGAGKTTIVKLMMRLYDIDTGRVLINGRDIREYDITSLRMAITSVFQEFQSYSLPIDEFVSCAEGDEIDKTVLREALNRVGLLEKIEASKNGIHTEYSKYFDENGLVFSGGQLQKLIIARMLYKGSDVLIMDEPSSALDPESEYEINRDIMEAAKGKTVILISHRLSTTRDADNIILIEDGEVKEKGAHKELLAQNGRYAHLFNIQARGYFGNATELEASTYAI